MKRFFIITNKSKDPDLKETMHIRDYLISKGAECEIAKRDSTSGSDGDKPYT